MAKEDSRETAPFADLAEEPAPKMTEEVGGIPADSKSEEDSKSDNTGKRIEDTLEAAQRKFHTASQLEKEYQEKLTQLNQQLGQQIEANKPKPEPVKPLSIEFGKDLADALIEDPDKALVELQKQLNSALGELQSRNERTVSELLYRIDELQTKSSISDEGVLQALELVNSGPGAQVLTPAEKLAMAQTIAERMGELKSQIPSKEPPVGMASGHSPQRQKAEKPKIDEGYFRLSGADRDLKDRTKVWG